MHPLLEELFAPEEPVYSADGMIPDDAPVYDLPPPPSPRNRMYIGHGGGPVDEFGFPLMDDGSVAPNNTMTANGRAVPPLGPLDTVPQWVREKMIADEKLRAARQYGSEIDSANRFYGRPDQYDPDGQLLPPPQYRGRIPAMPQPQRDRFMKGGPGGQDIINLDTGEVLKQGPAPRPSPMDYSTRSRKIPAIEAVEEVPAIPFQKKSFLGMDWAWPDQQAVAGRAAVAEQPEYTVTERVPNVAVPPIIAEQAMSAPQAALRERAASVPAAPTVAPNVTQLEYGKLKKGDPYWWNGKQLTKK